MMKIYLRINYIRWLLSRSDVETALKLLDPKNGVQDQILLDYIHKHWPGFSDPMAYARVYEEAGKIEARVTEAFQFVPQQDRFKMVCQIMAALGDCNTVLDYGCSRGIWATHLHNMFGKKWTLYDIDKTSIEEAKKIVRENARDPDAFNFYMNEDQPFFFPEGLDCLLLLEVLEHVHDPRALLETLIKQVRPGGAVIISVPSGPVEYTMWVDHPERLREHIREFTFDDLIDLFGTQRGFYLQYLNYGVEKYTGQPLGHFVAAWRKDGTPLGQINTDKKLTIRAVPDVPLP